jgi:hypothetical protein
LVTDDEIIAPKATFAGTLSSTLIVPTHSAC